MCFILPYLLRVIAYVNGVWSPGQSAQRKITFYTEKRLHTMYGMAEKHAVLLYCKAIRGERLCFL